MTDTVTIPRAEYERLLEIAEDAADERAVADFRADPKPGLSSEFVARMLDGESLVKLWREHRGLSIADLAKSAGVHRVSISKVEAGDRSLGLEMAQKIASVLQVSVDDLI